ncbi:hypothetical protein BGW38_000109 [Lunasporangiospora selenospora]|uniref:F-box domain-containing protein n=1 Tax=Lunasporangiospora selenospora TaxID=979761 RepID=A0A9P6KEF9_9FUNG|nr:hypothetical protein BGW38_000109 [Lunasporangiospora selenospora]
MTRRQPTLLDLPPELLTRIASWLSLCEYSHLARTCPILYGYLFHPSEVVHFLKTRYRLSIESGSLIIFAYLANIQIRAPRLLEKVFDEFFATNLALSEQSQKEQGLTTSRQNKGHLKSLCEKALDTRLTLIADPDQSAMQDTRESSKILTTEYGPCQEMQDVKTRQRAKRDAVRMLGVLYALDKTHIGFYQCLGLEWSDRYYGGICRTSQESCTGANVRINLGHQEYVETSTQSRVNPQVTLVCALALLAPRPLNELFDPGI